MYNGGLPDILLVAKPTYVAAIKELVVADTNGDGIAELVMETYDGQVRLFGNQR